jgi:aminotransferase in exopolysaccharide biosynthesis
MIDESAFATAVVEALGKVVGPQGAPLHVPEFSGNEWQYVKECLDTTFVSSVGQFVDQFEEGLARFTGATQAVAVVNGTAALHVALMLAGVRQGDEVLVQALTFVATANAIAYCGAIPHLVDSEDRSLGINVAKLRLYLEANTYQSNGRCISKESDRPIRAIVPMHTFGHPGDLDGLVELAHDFNLTLVEDAAESLGSYYAGRHTGTFGLVGTLSFNGNKTITTGGGGALLFNDAELAKRAKHLTTTAKLPHIWEFDHDVIGYNYRLPNINAALGCAQLEKLPAFLAEKRHLFELYSAAFEGVAGVRVLGEPEGCKSNFWLQALVIEPEYSHLRDRLLQETNSLAIMTRPVWKLLHKLASFQDAPRMDLSCAESLEMRILNIPSSPVLGRSEK